MKKLKTHYHPEVKNLENKSIFTRLATRSIAIQGDAILLLYTKRYEDYSLPGGGLDLGEDKIEGMIRELSEETGAQDIKNIKPFGSYEEYRPWYKPDYDIQHMISYCYTCDIKKELGMSNMESYEINNGMKALWINIDEAIAHNKKTMATSEKKGMSIERETFLLKLIAQSINNGKKYNP
jgi:ADP-ribose pyrophosphatase YjhB (NUDIX family)